MADPIQFNYVSYAVQKLVPTIDETYKPCPVDREGFLGEIAQMSAACLKTAVAVLEAHGYFADELERHVYLTEILEDFLKVTKHITMQTSKPVSDKYRDIAQKGFERGKDVGVSN